MTKFYKLPLLEFFTISSFLIGLVFVIYLIQATAWLVPQSFLIATISNCRQLFGTTSNNLIGSAVFLFGVFGLGIFLTSFKLFSSIIKLQIKYGELKLKKTNHPKKLNIILRKLNLGNDQVIYLNTNSIVACCLGLFNPKIIVSKGLFFKLNNKELEAVICHERKHLQNRHSLCLFLFSLFQNLFWMAPVFSLLKDKLKYRLELSADLSVINHFKNLEVLRKAKLALANETHTRFELGLNFSSDYNLRKKNIISQTELISKSLISLIGGVIIIFCLFNLHKPLEIHAIENNSQASCISHTTVENICKQKISTSHKTCEFRNYSAL